MKLLIVLLLGTISAALALTSPPSPSAVIYNDSAEFFFPVPGAKRTWKWFKEESPPNVLEYGWTVEIPFEDSSVRVSARKFKLADASPQNGTLEDLSHELQTDVWKKSENRKETISHLIGPAHAYAESRGLRIVLEDPWFVAGLRAKAPRTVILRTEGVCLDRERFEVPVTYDKR